MESTPAADARAGGQGAALSGLAQRLTLAGMYWAGGGWADYYYIRYTPP